MVVLIITFGVAIILPLIIAVMLRNFWTLLLCYFPGLIGTFAFVQPECMANRASEACTWGYMNYTIAFFIGGAIYLLVSLLQFIMKKANGANDKSKAIWTTISWILCLHSAGLATFILVLGISFAAQQGPVWFYGLIGFPTFIIVACLTAPSRKTLVALIAFVLLSTVSWPFLSELKKADSITPDYLPMIVSYSSGTFTVILIWALMFKFNIIPREKN